MKTITFYSYKGGVGRSLALANIASRLLEFGKKVCLLDFDLEAPGLHYKFHNSFKSLKIKKGIVDYIYDFTNSGLLGEIKDCAYSAEDLNQDSLTVIPAGAVDSSNYWQKLSSINWYQLLYENPSGLSFFLNLKDKIKKEINPDFLLIDSRTGISEISGITLSLLADEVVVIAANNRENIEGAKKIIKSLGEPNDSILGNSPKVTFVLSRIPFTEKPEDKSREIHLINKIKKEFNGMLSDINVIHSDRELEENEQLKIGYENDESTTQICRDYLNLFEKITIQALSASEISRFRDLKDSERFLQKSFSETNLIKKLEYINEAIRYNDSNKELYLYRAAAYENLGKTEQALEDCNYVLRSKTYVLQANEMIAEILSRQTRYSEAMKFSLANLDINSEYVPSLMNLALLYAKDFDYQKSIEYYKKVLDIDSTNAEAYNGLADGYRLLKQYETALDYVYKALELNPKLGIAYATLAEINAHQGNKNEFYLNFERCLEITPDLGELIIEHDSVYKQFYEEDRFNRLLIKYAIQPKQLK